MPFAGFKDFNDCVKKTMASKKWDKNRASAYCSVIKRKVEENKEKIEMKEVSSTVEKIEI